MLNTKLKSAAAPAAAAGDDDDDDDDEDDNGDYDCEYEVPVPCCDPYAVMICSVNAPASGQVDLYAPRTWFENFSSISVLQAREPHSIS